MDMTNEKVVEKRIYENDEKKEYASKGVAGTGLGLGIAGTALGLGSWLCGRGARNVFGSLGSGMPENVNINANGYNSASAPTAFQAWEKSCEDKISLMEKLQAIRDLDVSEKFSLYKGGVEALNAENRRAMQAEFGLYKSQVDADFGLYKNQRDQFDILNAKFENKFAELDKKVAVMEAIRPYQDKLLMGYTDQKTCNCIRGQVVLPSTPTITGYGSYCCQQQTSAPATAG